MFLTTRCCAKCLCVRTLLQPVDTGLCVTSSVSGPCYSLQVQVFVLPPLCQDPVTACRYSLCVTSSVSGPCYSLQVQVFVLPHSSVITTKNKQHVLTLCALWVEVWLVTQAPQAKKTAFPTSGSGRWNSQQTSANFD